MIYKTVVQITILSEGPFCTQGDDNDPFDLEAINVAITIGDCLGQTETISSDPVPPEQVEEECLKLGNDGTFFNIDDEEG